MIKINKSNDPPQILKENKKIWTDNLINAVKQYGGYSSIPKDEKEKLLKNYRHKEIQSALSESSFGKCAFCECIPSESGYLEVEHFAPKSIYYQLAFDWDNLLPVCRICNEAKSSHDTIIEPIVNPSKEDPKSFFDFNYILMVPLRECLDQDKAERTIEVCNLNSNGLVRARSDLLIQLTNYIKTLKSWINEFESADTDRKKKNRITKLIDSLEIIDSLTDSKEKYSFYSQNFLEKNPIYIKAKEIVK